MLTGHDDDRGAAVEQMLPWAVALGVEKQALSGMGEAESMHLPYNRPLGRRAGGTPAATALAVGSLAAGISAMAHSIGSSLAATPSKGGSSGGISSGGGGGGGRGGGGGW